MAFLDFMLDIETTGTDPAHTAILQIGAVAFNIESKEVSHAFFNQSMWIPPSRRWDEDTRVWWGKHQAVLQNIRAKARDPSQVMQEFQDWVLSFRTEGQTEGFRLWAKPISFDAPFIDSYFKEFGVQNPFHYTDVVDMRTFLRTRLGTWDVRSWEADRKMTGSAHNALMDALHQVKLVMEVA